MIQRVLNKISLVLSKADFDFLKV